MAVNPTDVRWILTKEAYEDLKKDREDWGEENYAQQTKAVQEFLCNYFNGGSGDCSSKFGKTVSPMGTNGDGGKILKVRWMRPGGGKSGGYRFVFVAYCGTANVVLCRALLRADDPSPDDIAQAAELARGRNSTWK